MFSGVSKSGSPAERPMMSRPCAYSSAALLVMAMVGEGFTRERVSERNGMTVSGMSLAARDGSRPFFQRRPAHVIWL